MKKKLSERLSKWWYKWHSNFPEKDCREIEKIIKDLEKQENDE